MSYITICCENIQSALIAGEQLGLHVVKLTSNLRLTPNIIQNTSMAAYFALEYMRKTGVIAKDQLKPLSATLEATELFDLLESVELLCKTGNDVMQLLKQDNLTTHIYTKISHPYTTLLHSFSKVNWITMSVGTILCYAKEWNIIDIAGLSQRMGAWPLLGAIKDSDLGKIVKSAFCLATFSDFIETCIEIYHSDATTIPDAQELQAKRYNLTIKAVSKLSTGFFHAAGLLTYGKPTSDYLCLAGCLARSISVLSNLSDQTFNTRYPKKI